MLKQNLNTIINNCKLSKQIKKQYWDPFQKRELLHSCIFVQANLSTFG